MRTQVFFTTYLENVKNSAEWQSMVDTVENTGWHREANVAVHTEMTIDHYLKTFAPHRTERQQMLALMALLFHDFGKPASESTNAEGRHQYLGHEEVSATNFWNFMRSEIALTDFFFDQGYHWGDVNAIKFVIERHLPYGMKQPKKVQALKDQIKNFLGDDEEVFFDVLRSDSAGRIQDNREQRLQEVEDWINGFRAAPKWVDKDSPEERARRKAEWQARQAEKLAGIQAEPGLEAFRKLANENLDNRT